MNLDPTLLIKRIETLVLIIIILILSGFSIHFNIATGAPDGTITVCATGCDYSTIQAAINSASLGDNIQLSDPIHVESGIIVSKTLIISGRGQNETIVQANDQPKPDNGRIFLIDIDKAVVIQDMTIRHGGTESGFGGGIYNEGDLTLVNVNVSDNQAGASGGGIYSSGPLDLIGSTVSENSTNKIFGGGGGIFAELTSVNIESSTISDNEAAYGGGIFFRNGNNLSIVNSTLSGNRADGEDEFSDGGGAINVFHFFTPTVSIAYSTFSDNISEVAGRDGLWLEAGVATIEATIFDHANGNCFISGGLIQSNGYNIESADTCGFDSIGDMASRDPHLVPLADNGGPTETHWLLPGSPAINAIPISSCQPNRDQRGAVRPKHNGCDIGAVEVNYKLLLPFILNSNN